MKTRSGVLFSSQASPKRRKKTAFPVFDIFPREIWLEILKHLDKNTFREVASTCQLLHEFLSEHEIYAKLSWPLLDYQNQYSNYPLSKVFAWENIGSEDDGKPQIFTLSNGDVCVVEEDGTLNLLRFGDSEWCVLGRHSQKTLDGRIKQFKIRDVILLESGEIASCAIDSIRIWDRKLAQEKYQIVLPGYSALSARPYSLIQLSKFDLACSCVDGSVHLLRLQQMSSGNKFTYQFAFPLLENKKAYLLNMLTTYQNELIAEYSHFIMRWNWRTGQIIERIDIERLKEKVKSKLISCLDRKKILSFSERHIRQQLDQPGSLELTLEWESPRGFVRVILESKYHFLTSIVNSDMDVLYLGYRGFTLKITEKNDMVLLDKDGGNLKWGWDPEKNQFTRCSYIDAEFLDGSLRVMSDGNVLISRDNSNKVLIFNRMTNMVRSLTLELSETEGYDDLEVLNNHYLSGTVNGNYFCIWDIKTGALQFGLDNGDDDVQVLPSGYLLANNKKQALNGYYNGEYTGIYAGEDELEVYRFGLKK